MESYIKHWSGCAPPAGCRPARRSAKYCVLRQNLVSVRSQIWHNYRTTIYECCVVIYTAKHPSENSVLFLQTSYLPSSRTTIMTVAGNSTVLCAASSTNHHAAWSSTDTLPSLPTLRRPRRTDGLGPTQTAARRTQPSALNHPPADRRKAAAE